MKIGTKSVLFGAHQFLIHPWFVAWAWWRLYGFPLDPRLWVAFFVHDLGYVGKPNMDGPEGERHVEFGAAVMHRLFDRTADRDQGRWEAVKDQDGDMVRVRWSTPGPNGEHLYVRHYPGGSWGKYAAQSDADRFNTEGRSPWEWHCYRGGPVRSMAWRNFCLYHSRFYAKRDGVRPSRLCAADKLAVSLEPWWLYLPRVILTGEIEEYMAKAGGMPGSKYNGEKGGGKYLSMNLVNNDPALSLWQKRRYWFTKMTDYLRRWAYEHRDGREDTWTPKPVAEGAQQA